MLFLLLTLISQEVDYAAYMPSAEQTALWAEFTYYIQDHPEYSPVVDAAAFDSLYLAWFGPLPEVPEGVAQRLEGFYNGQVYIMDLSAGELAYLRDYYDVLNYTHFVEYAGPGSTSPPAAVPDEPPPVDTAEFSSANVHASGPAPVIDRIRFRLQAVQDTYDAIEAQALAGDYDRAGQFVDGLRETLGNIEADLAAAESTTAPVITFSGLPTDSALVLIRDLDEQKTRNHEFYIDLSRRIDDLEDALQTGRLEFLLNLWRGTYQSLLSYPFPPAWYSAPSTFITWQEQAEKHASGLLTPAQVLFRLPDLVEELRQADARAREEHARITDELESMVPVQDLHAELTALLDGLSWAGFIP